VPLLCSLITTKL